MKDNISILMERGFSCSMLSCGLSLEEIKAAADGYDIPDNNIEHVKKLLAKKTITSSVIAKNDSVLEVPCCTSDNFRIIFEEDVHFASIRFNTIRAYPERMRSGKRTQWTDADDSEARAYIELNYGIYNRQKADDGFSAMLQRRKYNPVQERIASVEWDGVPRCETFLTKWIGAPDNEYTRECSRLLFAGGINRAFCPACKFDCVIVLIGPQGGGKSTLCRWLALDDDFYTSTKTISGQRGLESIQGKWIVEIEELLAVLANEQTGQKMEEAAKAFLSSQSDFYRKPYERRAQDTPRHCVFIGTTNRETFLTDKTGNRRWFPVKCSLSASNLYVHEKEIKADIEQAWAEMLRAFNRGESIAKPAEQMNLLATIKNEQTSAEVEDWRVGVVGEYIANRDRVCLLELWHEAIYPGAVSPPQMSRKDSNNLAEILVHSFGAVRGSVAQFGKPYGKQKAFYLPGANKANENNMELLP